VPPAEASDPLEIVGRLIAALAGYGVEHAAVTGSTALGVWASPRQSRDLDICASVPPEAVPRILARFDGIAAGPPEDPGVLRLRFLDWDVDVFVTGDDPYDAACASRAVEVSTQSSSVRVVSAEDLLIHKFIKIRTDRRRILQDLADMRALIESRGASVDWEYLRLWLPKSESDLLDALAALDDQALVARILGTKP
jgi:hypothetical protein